MPVLAKCSHCDEPFEKPHKFCPNCGLCIIGGGFTDTAGVAVRDLFNIAKNFSSVLDIDMLLRRISETAEKLTQAEASSVMLVDEKREYLYFKVAGGEKSSVMKTIKVPMGHGIAGWCAQSAQPLLIDDVLKDERFNRSLADDKSGFKTKSILCVPMMIQDRVVGVMEVLNKREDAPGGGRFTVDDQDILESLAGFAAVSIENSRLTSDQKNFFANIIEILIAAIEGVSKNSAGHSWRVAQSSCTIARRLKIAGQGYKNIYYAAMLHDVGYVGVRRQIASGKNFGSPERSEMMHPVVGAEMVSSIRLLESSAPLIRSHHECWDGSGFPDGLKGENIPIGARIISFVEAIEDFRDKCKKEGTADGDMPHRIEQYAFDNIDKLFDPQVVAAYSLELSQSSASQG